MNYTQLCRIEHRLEEIKNEKFCGLDTREFIIVQLMSGMMTANAMTEADKINRAIRYADNLLATFRDERYEKMKENMRSKGSTW
jgi:hypothetical protein